jgi:hypothetical protein
MGSYKHVEPDTGIAQSMVWYIPSCWFIVMDICLTPDGWK